MNNASGPGALVVVAAIACIVALMMPTHGEQGSSLPEYIQLTVNQKLIAAYILGKKIWMIARCFIIFLGLYEGL